MQAEFSARKKRNSRYSVRAFARDLGLSPSHLSEFLSGKSNISHEKAPSLAEKLKLSGAHKEHWCDLLMVQSKYQRDRDAAAFRIRQRLEDCQGAVSLKVFQVISDWYYFAILACFGGCSKMTIPEVGSRLNISEEKIEKAIDDLVQVKLLSVTDEGFVPTDDYSLVGNAIPSEAVRESHKQVLNKAAEALDYFDMSSRESQSLFITVPRNQLPAFREALKNRVLQAAAEFSKTDLNKEDLSVQAITLQVFPLEKLDEK